jgi:WD40 repeat protein
MCALDVMLSIISGMQFLATGSRDRMVHVFSNVEDGYTPVQSLPDHSAAVTAIGFTVSEDGLQLLSSGADKSIIFHLMEKNEVRRGGREEGRGGRDRGRDRGGRGGRDVYLLT